MRLRRRPARRRRVDEEIAGPPVVEEEQYVPPRRPPIPEIWPWLLLLLLLVIGGLAAAYFLTRDNNHHKSSASAVTVPAVVGLKQSNAVRRLDERGLVPQLATGPSKFPAGTVFAQNPGAGTHVDRGSLVRVSVSATAQVSVPNVAGDKTSVAVSRLKAAGLQSQVTAVPAKAAPGVVVKESPVAGTSVAKGSTVSLRVSKGETTVPDVRGQPAADAKAALQTAGLVPAEFKVPSAQPKGTVTAQKPLPNKQVPRGSKVRINVSTGSASSPGTTTSGTTTGGTTTTAAPATVKVPNVVGLQQTVAQRRLHSAGLGARVKYVSSQKPSGQVVAESPAAGATVKRRATVQISVSLGPSATTTQVPDVVGQDQQTATSTLQNAGFQVQAITVPASDPSQNGTVIDEQPSGGTRAPDGSTVTIYVGSSG
jgi:beta-lactam-binding protein with PASTA domain